LQWRYESFLDGIAGMNLESCTSNGGFWICCCSWF